MPTSPRVPVTYLVHHADKDYWQAHCGCGWEGIARRSRDEQAVRDCALCHTIETGHQLATEPRPGGFMPEDDLWG